MKNIARFAHPTHLIKRSLACGVLKGSALEFEQPKKTRMSAMKHRLLLPLLTAVSLGFVGLVLPASATETWQGLTVEPENRCTHYDKVAQYPYPQSLEDKIVADMGGEVYGPYTGRYFQSDTETDIEHIVAASEGHDSGLCAASQETRIQFATDPLNLTLAAPEVNRCGTKGKCGLDAAEWLPAKNQCWFANRIVEIKRKYSLSVDRAEANALEAILANCESFDMIFFEKVELAETVSPAATSEDALTLFDDNGNGRITCAEARAHGIAPVYRQHPAYAFMNDRNKDGVVCE